MSIASPTTTTVANNASPATNSLTSLFHSLTKKHSLAPVVQRFLGLCVHNQGKQNDLTPPSSSSSSAQQEHTEKLIRNLLKKLTKLKRQGSIDELERAILHKDSRTKCVTIPRSDLIRPENVLYPTIFLSLADHSRRLWIRHRSPIRWWSTLAFGVGRIYPIKMNWNPSITVPMPFSMVEMIFVSTRSTMNAYQVSNRLSHLSSTLQFFFLAKYSVYVPHLPPEAFRDMPDLRSASMSDILPNQIPENTTYQSTIEPQQSPQSYPLSPGSISSQGTEKFAAERCLIDLVQILFSLRRRWVTTTRTIIILITRRWSWIFPHRLWTANNNWPFNQQHKRCRRSRLIHRSTRWATVNKFPSKNLTNGVWYPTMKCPRASVNNSMPHNRKWSSMVSPIRRTPNASVSAV